MTLATTQTDTLLATGFEIISISAASDRVLEFFHGEESSETLPAVAAAKCRVLFKEDKSAFITVTSGAAIFGHRAYGVSEWAGICEQEIPKALRRGVRSTDIKLGAASESVVARRDFAAPIETSVVQRAA